MWDFPWASIMRYYALAVEDIRAENKAAKEAEEKRERIFRRYNRKT